MRKGSMFIIFVNIIIWFVLHDRFLFSHGSSLWCMQCYLIISFRIYQGILEFCIALYFLRVVQNCIGKTTGSKYRISSVEHPTSLR